MLIYTCAGHCCPLVLMKITAMNNIETNTDERYRFHPGYEQGAEWRKRQQNGRVWTGIFLLLIGCAAIVRYTFPVPEWLFSWQMILITLGLFMIVRHGLRMGPGLVLIIVGGVNLLWQFFPDVIDRRMIWPIVLITVGVFLIFNPRRKHHRRHTDTRSPDGDTHADSLIYYEETAGPNENQIDCVSIFGGLKKHIYSKSFRGGELVNIMGGTDLNLSQADIQGTVYLEITQVFGGTKIIVPPHWVVQPEMAAIFAGIEDKRRLPPGSSDESKVLVIKGTTVFGGVEVKSF